MKHIFLEGDNSYLNDHNFPVPGYLLSVSGHMFIANDNPTNHTNISNESAYAAETLTNTEPHFTQFVANATNCDIFKVLSRQASIQWDIKMTGSECRDTLKDTVEIDSDFESIIAASSKIFQCNVVVFSRRDNDLLSQTTSCGTEPKAGLLYIFREDGGKELPLTVLYLLLLHT